MLRLEGARHQPGANDWVRAVPHDPATSIQSEALRIRLLRQLRLPLPQLPSTTEDPYGDALPNANGCTFRHSC